MRRLLQSLATVVVALVCAPLSAQITIQKISGTNVLSTTSQPVVFPPTALRLQDTNASNALILTAGSDLTANRTFTLITGDADRSLTLTGNLTLNDWFDQSVKVAASPTFAGLTLSSPLAVGGGGTGAATLTGHLKGNGTSAFTASATIPVGDITGLATVATSGSAADLSGNLAVARFNSGTSASASTFWRGDGQWVTPAGGGNVTGPLTSTDNAIARMDGTTGTIIQNSALTVADTTGAIAGFTSGNGLTFHGGGAMSGASGALTIAPAINTDLNLTPTGTGAVSSVTAYGGTSNYFPWTSVVTHTPSGSAGGAVTSIYGRTVIAGSQAALGDSGIRGDVTHTNTNTSSIHEAVLGHIAGLGTGVKFTYSAGFRTSLDYTLDTLVNGNVYGLYVPQVDISGAGSLGGQIYGVLVSDLYSGDSAHKTEVNVIGVSASGTANTTGLQSTSTGSATLGSQKYSPWLRLRGNGYATNLSDGRSFDFGLQTRPVQGAAMPSGTLIFAHQANGAGWNTLLTLDSLGTASTSASTGSMVLATGGMGIAGAVNAGSYLGSRQNSLGTSTTTVGLDLVNATSAAAGAQQNSPVARWVGQGWKTNATAASQQVEMLVGLRAEEAQAAPGGTLAFSYKINSGSAVDVLAIKTSGFADNFPSVQVKSVTGELADLRLISDRTSDNTVTGSVRYYGNDSSAQSVNYATISGKILDRTSGSIDGTILLQTAQNSVMSDAVTITGGTGTTINTGNLTVSVGSLIVPTQTPASASAAGTAGTITWDSSFIYICVSTNTWKRAAIATW